jgi:hypothetical protein
MAEGPGPEPPAEPTFFVAFDHLLETCRRTRAALLSIVSGEQRDADATREVLGHEALDHVESVLEGLTLLLRTSQLEPEELRALVRRAGIIPPPVAGSVDAIAADEESAHSHPALRTIDGRTMLAAGHARVVFSLIPRLPAEAVAWPRRHPTYADIPTPRSEGELMLRAEELVRVVWRLAAGDERRDESLRRTVAFYDAGSRLSVRGGFRAA